MDIVFVFDFVVKLGVCIVGHVYVISGDEDDKEEGIFRGVG